MDKKEQKKFLERLVEIQNEICKAIREGRNIDDIMKKYGISKEKPLGDIDNVEKD